MAEIVEIFDEAGDGMKDIGKKIKKKFKEKPVFYTALICVAGFALYKLFTTPEEYVEYVDETVQPNTYDGYPIMSDPMIEDYDSLMGGSTGGGWLGGSTGGGIIGGGSTSAGQTNGEGSSYIEDSYIYVEDDSYIRELEEQLFYLEEQLQLMEEYPANSRLTFTDDGEVYDMDTGALIYSESQPYRVLLDNSEAAQVQKQMEQQANLKWRSQQLQQMQANSSAWSKATTQAEKDALHAENQSIAKGLGLTYNSNTGKWYEADGSEALIYSAGGSNKTGSTSIVKTSNSSSSYGGVSYDKSVDYAAKIAAAKASGASQSVIDKLTAQRNAKIAGENLNADGSKKTSSSSSKTSSSSSKTSTTSSSSGGVSYDKNKDYAQAIKDAKASGASQATINNLQAQREAKIKGENLNSDGSKKK